MISKRSFTSAPRACLNSKPVVQRLVPRQVLHWNLHPAPASTRGRKHAEDGSVHVLRLDPRAMHCTGLQRSLRSCTTPWLFMTWHGNHCVVGHELACHACGMLFQVMPQNRLPSWHAMLAHGGHGSTMCHAMPCHATPTHMLHALTKEEKYTPANLIISVKCVVIQHLCLQHLHKRGQAGATSMQQLWTQ